MKNERGTRFGRRASRRRTEFSEPRLDRSSPLGPPYAIVPPTWQSPACRARTAHARLRLRELSQFGSTHEHLSFYPCFSRAPIAIASDRFIALSGNQALPGSIFRPVSSR